MALLTLGQLLLWLLAVTITAAVSTGSSVRTRGSPNLDEASNVVKRTLSHSVQPRDTVYRMNKTSLAKSWSGATLFQYGASSIHNTSVAGERSSVDLSSSIAIVCSTCYVNGTVSGSFTLNGDFNATQAIDSIGNEIANMSTAAFDTLKNYTEEVAETLAEDITQLEINDFPAFPTLDVDFNMQNISNFEGAKVVFEFDALELYLDLDIVLSAGATYTLTIFSSETPAGFAVPGLEAGAVFSIDLILIAEAEIELGSGIHMKLDDGLIFDLEMFDGAVSSVTVPDGQFEFLPINIDGKGSIQALLAMKATMGLDVSTTSQLSHHLKFSTGVEADVFAYLADFLLTVNGTTDASDGECELAAVAEYTVGLGAAAGATVAVDTYAWGPTPATTIPVFYTTLASVCAATRSGSAPSSTITPRAYLDPRADMTTSTLSSEESYTIVNCLSTGLVQCPVNLQNTTSYQTTVTKEVVVQSGADAEWPTTTHASVTSAIPFGKDVRKLKATSGAPTSYVPPSTATASASVSATGSSEPANEKTQGTNNKLIIGLSVGLGVPALIAIVGVVSWLIYRRRQYTLVQSTQPAPQIGSSSPPTAAAPLMAELPKSSHEVRVTDY